MRKIILSVMLIGAILAAAMPAQANPPPVIWCPGPTGKMVLCSTLISILPTPTAMPSVVEQAVESHAIGVGVLKAAELNYWRWLIFGGR